MKQKVATLVQIPLISPYHFLQSIIPFSTRDPLFASIHQMEHTSLRVYCACVFFHGLGCVIGQLILLGCLVLADCLVNQDCNEFPRNSTQSRKNSRRKCLQARKSASVTSHSLGVCEQHLCHRNVC